MRRTTWTLLGLAVGAGLATGCVERRYVIETDPPGAIVYRNGHELGATPVDDHFVYYGNYHFTIKKEGFQTQQIDQPIPAPWYQWFPLDFISEVLVPVQLEDVHRFRYALAPVEQPRVEDLLRESENLRNRGHTLPPPPGGYRPPAPPVVRPETAPGPPPGQGRQIGPHQNDGPNPAPPTGATLPAPRRLPPE